MQGTLQDIRESGAKPVGGTKSENLNRDKRIATTDDRMAGMLLAQQVLAHEKTEANRWLLWSLALLDMTHEGREAFINAVKADRSAMTKGQTEFGIAEKQAKVNTRSFGVYVSDLSAIAKGINAGATLAGWMDYMNQMMPDGKRITDPNDLRTHGNWRMFAAYARQFLGTQSARPKDTFLTKMGKLLERNKPADDNPAELKQWDAFVALYNKLAG